MQEPQEKRTVVFIDGQNLFHRAKAAFGYRTPTYDVTALAALICRQMDWTLRQIRFYTGLPDERHASELRAAWTAKLARMGQQGVITCTRPLRYSGMPPVGREKGIDVRIALDIVRLGRTNEYDVGLVLSQDQDLIEAINDIKDIAKQQKRWIKIASAFPASVDKRLNKGLYGTDWIPIDAAMYASCLEKTPFYSAPVQGVSHRPARR